MGDGDDDDDGDGDDDGGGTADAVGDNDGDEGKASGGSPVGEQPVSRASDTANAPTVAGRAIFWRATIISVEVG